MICTTKVKLDVEDSIGFDVADFGSETPFREELKPEALLGTQTITRALDLRNLEI